MNLDRDNISREIIVSAFEASSDEFPRIIEFLSYVLNDDPEHVDALYFLAVVMFRGRRHIDAISYCRRAYSRIPELNAALEALDIPDVQSGSDEAAKPFAERLVFDLIAERLLGENADDPGTYKLLCFVCHRLKRFDDVRRFLKIMGKNCEKGFHYQPGLIASLEEADPALFAEISRRAAGGDGEGAGEVAEIENGQTLAVYREQPVLGPADVETDNATPVGVGGATLNGSLGGTNLPTRYCFRYGTDPENLDLATPERALPPGRLGRVMDMGANPCHRITSYGCETGFRDTGKGGDASMVLISPFGKDRNHVNGIGAIDLLLGWHSAVHIRDKVDAAGEGAAFPLKEYPGEKIDLRDAEVSVLLRGRDFDARDFFLVAWFHCDCGTAATRSMEDTGAWALTGEIGGPQPLGGGDWRELRFKFSNNSNDWSYAGNNVEEMGGESERYRYLPINDALRRNRGNICLAFVCGDELDTPQGEIELASIALRYRSRSLLTPGFGTRIVAWPDGPANDPARLAGGWIGDRDHFWRSGPGPGRPQEFVWRFKEETSLESVRVFQNPQWPARDIEVSISADGERYSQVWSAELYPNRAGTVGSGDDAPPAGPSNLAAIRIFDEPAACTFLKLSILSGHREEFWGLDAVEAFGTGAEAIPETDPCTVSEEVTGLPPGTRMYYRLVAENGAGRTLGDVKYQDIPADGRPILHWARCIGRKGNSATLLIRITAMGSFTELSGRFENARTEVVCEGKISVGRSETPRHVTFVARGLEPGEGYLGTLIASNEWGNSVPLEFEANPIAK